MSFGTTSEEHIKIASLLLDYGADVNVCFKEHEVYFDSRTALHMATTITDDTMIKFLISRGASLDTMYEGNSPFIYAMGFESYDSGMSEYRHELSIDRIRVFLENGADINEKSWFPPRSALFYACYYSTTIEIPLFMIEKGAKECEHSDGTTDLDHFNSFTFNDASEEIASMNTMTEEDRQRNVEILKDAYRRQQNWERRRNYVRFLEELPPLTLFMEHRSRSKRLASAVFRELGRAICSYL